MEIREADKADLFALLALYDHLHGNPVPKSGPSLDTLWSRIVSDPDHHILIGWIGDKAVSSCVCVVIPNLTREQRPYALIENVVTHPDYRAKGYATALLNHARSIAQQAGCYKIMLMTGAKDSATLSFYERAGYNRQDKTAFIQWFG